jgi:hypothetical protein
VQDREASSAAAATRADDGRSTPTLAVTRLAPEMGLLLRAGRVLLCATVVASATPACYSAGAGTAPPTRNFYFPVGLAVSAGGRVLYAVNSDFDLQWNGGTLQSYDLGAIRADAAALVAYNTTSAPGPDITNRVSALFSGHPPAPCATGTGVPVPGMTLGQACAPPIDSTHYVKDSVIVGAFATDLQLLQNVLRDPQGRVLDRLFFPVRGTASLTWANVAHDPGGQGDPDYFLDCRRDSSGRCDSANQAGSDPYQSGNTRHTTMPGEPFGLALSQDGTAVAITHQTDTKTSLLTSGLGSTPSDPTMEFVLDGLPQGGNGIAAVPHDPDAANFSDATNFDPTKPFIRPAFLQTSRAIAELDLLRYYSDDDPMQRGASLHRPFLQRERTWALTANSIGSDSRGIAIDASPRLACKREHPSDLTSCGRRPARVFFANRAPPSLVIGEIGETAGDGSYDPDAFVITGNVPVSSGPSRVYLAPVVLPGPGGAPTYAMRVFVVCFDSGAIFIFDPEVLGASGALATPENVIYTGAGTGPFAMTFDPISPQCAVNYPTDSNGNNCPVAGAGSRFAYVANFTQSFVQMIDLDGTSASAPKTFEQVVFTLGNPTQPKGQ